MWDRQPNGNPENPNFIFPAKATRTRDSPSTVKDAPSMATVLRNFWRKATANWKATNVTILYHAVEAVIYVPCPGPIFSFMMSKFRLHEKFEGKEITQKSLGKIRDEK